MRTNEQIINFLNSLREEQGLSISEVSRRVNISKSAVSKYFNKTREFPVNKVDRFASALHTTSEEILGLNKSKGTVDEVLDNLVAFNGKPVSDHDREVLKGLIESYLSNRG